MNKYRILLNNTFLISAGTFGSKLLTFLMVRFYTEVLTPSDYGTADLIIQTANLLLPLVSMGIAESVFRFALNDSLGRRKVFSVGVMVTSIGALLLIMASPILSSFSDLSGIVWLITVYCIASCYHSLCAQFVRAEGKMALFAGQGVLNTAMVVALNILFLAIFNFGITGYVFSIALADILCSIFLVIKERLWKQFIIYPGKKAFYRMLQYSIPLIPTTIFWWITSVSDRFMLTAFIGSEANGLYAIACKIPTLLTLLSGIFLGAWQFSAISETSKGREEHIHFYSQIWGAFMAVMFLAGSTVTAFSKVGVRLLTTQVYYEAWQYIPVLSAAMVFSSFVTFMGSVYVVEKKSILSFWTAMAGAVINLLLNRILIPTPLGIQGAAIATFVSYFAVFLLRSKNARKLIPFRLYKMRLLINCLVIFIQIGAVFYENDAWWYMQIICFLIVIIINGKALWLDVKKIYQMKYGDRR